MDYFLSASTTSQLSSQFLIKSTSTSQPSHLLIPFKKSIFKDNLHNGFPIIHKDLSHRSLPRNRPIPSRALHQRQSSLYHRGRFWNRASHHSRLRNVWLNKNHYHRPHRILSPVHQERTRSPASRRQSPDLQSGHR